MADNDKPRRLDSYLDAARELAPEPIPLQRGYLEQDRRGSPSTLTSGIPRRRQNDTFESFDVKRAPKLRRALMQTQLVAQGRASCAFLVGGTGTGKTHLAIAAMHAFGLTRSWFWKVPDFLEFMRVQAYGENLGVFGVLQSYVAGDFLLVLDDLGTEKTTDWAAEQLYRVIDARTDNGLPLIVTSNEALEKIDVRLLSRLASGYVNCDGDDQRLVRAGLA